MSVAADTRAAVRERPFMFEALRAGVLNYAAAARHLDLAEDEEVVAAALRRFGESLADREQAPREGTVTMRSGIGPVGSEDEDESDTLLRVGGVRLGPTGGDYTGVLATGDVDPATLEYALGVCRANEVDVTAAGIAGGVLTVVVDRRDGPAALRHVEAALEAAPDPA